jgi:hypothetical protein
MQNFGILGEHLRPIQLGLDDIRLNAEKGFEQLGALSPAAIWDGVLSHSRVRFGE